MRPIKFRGKRLDNGEWIYGNYFFDDADGSVQIQWVEIIPPTLSEPGGDCRFERHEVNPKTVGQRTGCGDKNGKEIFEGDLVRIYNEYEDEETVSEVRFAEGGFVVEWSGGFSGGDADVTLIGWAMNEEMEFEVVGNIYDNPEMLKK